MRKNLRSKVFLVGSIIIAALGWYLPQRRMPLDFHVMLWWSIPIACAWFLLLIVAALWLKRRAFWMLLGAPLALYWPIWLLLNHIPPCYWQGNCV